MTMPPDEVTGTGACFPSPLDLATPPGCEGWEEMYPYHAVFAEDQREFAEGRFWYRNSLHAAEPYFPFDVVSVDAAFSAFNHANNRLFAVPQSRGNDWRLLFGHNYNCPNPVSAEITAQRAELFARRAGHYYTHWDELYARWVPKVEAEILALAAIAVPELPEFEDESVVIESTLGSHNTLLIAYSNLLESLYRIWQYHFEFLNLGYGAYFAFYELCREIFPASTSSP